MTGGNSSEVQKVCAFRTTVDEGNTTPPNYGVKTLSDKSVLFARTTVDEGGETVFPNAVDKDRVQGDQWSACAKRGLAVKAAKGDALLFFR